MKFIFTLITLLTCLFVNAQTYVEFPDSNASWKITKVTYPDLTNELDGFSKSTLSYIVGEKEIQSLEYIAIKIDDEFDSDFPDTIYIRESNKVIYYYDQLNSIDHILYDFNLNVGDTFSYGNELNDILIVHNIDSIQIGEKFHKRYSVMPPLGIGNIYEYIDLYFVEGIGSNQGLFYPFNFFYLSGGFIHFDCFMRNDTTFSIDGSGDFDLSGDICNYTFTIDEEINDINVFYDRDNKYINIDLSDGNEQGNYELINSLGQVIRKGQLSGEIYVQNISQGLYIFKYYSSNKSIYSYKFIKD